MSFGFKFSVVLVLSLLVFGCSTAPRAGEDRLPTGIQTDLPIPDQTILLVRIAPDGHDEIVPLVASSILPGSRVDSALSLVEAFFLRSEGLISKEALVENAPIFVAVTLRGNEEHLARARLGIPAQGKESIYQGFSYRVILPATNPESLAEHIRERASSESIRRVATQGPFTVVDTHWHAFGDEYSSSPVLDQEDSAYLSRSTPALEEFFAASGHSLYMKSADLGLLGAMHIGLLGLELFESASPWSRVGVLDSNAMDQSIMMQIDDPGVREVEDMSLTLGIGENGQLDAILLQSLTAFGADLSSSEGPLLSRPLEEGEALHFLFKSGLASGGEQVRAPIWLTVLEEALRAVMELEGEEYDPIELNYYLQELEGISYAFLTQVVQSQAYRNAMGELGIDVAEIAASGYGSALSPFGLLPGITRASGTLSVQRSDGEMRGLSGHVQVEFRSDSSWELPIQFLEGALAGFVVEDIERRVEERGDRRVVHLLLGAEENRPPLPALPEVVGMDLQLNLDSITTALRAVSPPEMAEVIDLMELVSSSRIVHSAGSTFRETRFSTQSFQPNQRSFTGFEPKVFRSSPCEEPLWGVIAAYLLQMNKDHLLYSGALEELRSDCPDLDEEGLASGIRALRNLEAYRQVTLSNFEGAQQLYQESCDQGSSLACRELEQLDRFLSLVELPVSRRSSFDMEQAITLRLFITPDGSISTGDPRSSPRLIPVAYGAELEEVLESAERAYFYWIHDYSQLTDFFWHAESADLPVELISMSGRSSLRDLQRLANAFAREVVADDGSPRQSPGEVQGMPLFTGLLVRDEDSSEEPFQQRFLAIAGEGHLTHFESPVVEVRFSESGASEIEATPELMVDGRVVAAEELQTLLENATAARPVAFVLQMPADSLVQDFVDAYYELSTLVELPTGNAAIVLPGLR